MLHRLADPTSSIMLVPCCQANHRIVQRCIAGNRESRLVLLTTHSAGSESSTRSTGGGAGSENERSDGTDGEPVGVTLSYLRNVASASFSGILLDLLQGVENARARPRILGP